MYTYDGNGNITAVQLPGGQTSYNTFDSQNNLTKEQDFNSNITSSDYDSNNNQTESTDANVQTSASRYYANSNLQYDTKPMSVADNKLANSSFELDNNTDNWPDNWTKATETGKTATYAYEYDAAGNRTKKTVTQGQTNTTTNYTYDAANQLTAVNGQAYTYDSNGNLTDNGSETFIYDVENHLIEVKKSDGTSLATFTYDQEGKRTSMTTSTGTTNFHYNGDKVIYETDSNNNVVADYTWDDQGNPVTMTKGGVTYYYHVNGHGDVTALTDGTGNTVAQYQYDAWGNITSSTGSMKDANPYRYAGYRYDNETGLYYLMARYYDLNVGRFITRDTFDGLQNDPLSLNQYAYTKNNPVMYTDPTGHIGQIVAGALVGAAINAVSYIAGLIAKYGIKKAWRHLSTWSLLWTMGKGAVAGALGFGIVNKLKRLGKLSSLGSKILGGHLAPAAYILGNIGNPFGVSGFLENQALSFFNEKANFIYAAAKPFIIKIYNKYKNWR